MSRIIQKPDAIGDDERTVVVGNPLLRPGQPLRLARAAPPVRPGRLSRFWRGASMYLLVGVGSAAAVLLGGLLLEVSVAQAGEVPGVEADLAAAPEVGPPPAAAAATIVPAPLPEDELNLMVWPVASDHVTSRFALRRLDPVTRAEVRRHRGVDIRCKSGTPVQAAAEGLVLFAGRRGKAGRVVILAHPNRQGTVYAHLSKIEVARGTRVIAGQRLGLSGATGHATGPHLHFEVWKDRRPQDPMALGWRDAPIPDLPGAVAYSAAPAR
jgi:murein DD-endopeptidase MepM/ murein hydrolase activator NlpD